MKEESNHKIQKSKNVFNVFVNVFSVTVFLLESTGGQQSYNPLTNLSYFLPNMFLSSKHTLNLTTVDHLTFFTKCPKCVLPLQECSLCATFMVMSIIRLMGGAGKNPKKGGYRDGEASADC